MARMKALKTFRVGSSSRSVSPGDEFETSNPDHYEKKGYAVRVAAAVKAKRSGPLKNKAAEDGPLASAGGRTGADASPSSSPAGHRRATRRSTQSEAEQE